jgi:hypothetical protein
MVAIIFNVRCHESAGLGPVTRNEGRGNEDFGHNLNGMDVEQVESDALRPFHRNYVPLCRFSNSHFHAFPWRCVKEKK